jgi:hypothetical protein
MKMYQKLNVPELPLIQKELLEYINRYPDDVFDESATSEYCHSVGIKDFPILSGFLLPRLKLPLQYINILIVPPVSNFNIHLDGNNELHQKVVITIPIKNYEESVTHWYDHKDIKEEYIWSKFCANDKPPYNGYTINFIKEEIVLQPIASTTVDKVTLMRADWYHGVENSMNENRIVIVIRCGDTMMDKNVSFEDLMEFRDLI